MKHFAELKGDRLIQILHTEEVPQQDGYSYFEILEKDFPKSFTPPFEGAYLSYKDGFYWKSNLTQNEILEKQAKKVKELRNQLLTETDWTQLPDVPQAIQQKYLTYRQDLRDLSSQPGFPNNVVWPVKPV